MTTLQIRSGDQYAIVHGDDLIVSLQGLFKLDAVDDHVILEVPTATPADSAQIENLRLRLTEAIQARDSLKVANRHLRDSLDTYDSGQIRLGRNFWNGSIASDAPNKRGPYRVNLYRMGDGAIQGFCQCLDWHLQGLGQGDLTYHCKHVVKAMSEARAHVA